MKQSMIIIGVVILLILGIGGYMAMSSQSSKPQAQNSNSMTQASEAEDEKMNNQEEKTIVDIASENGNFKTLVAAVNAAGLVETLSGEGPFTVFAPTDEAFAKLPAGTVESLLQDKEKLTKILTYHVVSGKVPSEEVIKMNSATTVQGQDVSIVVEGDKVMVNNSNVTMTDIQASNGVIHVIDTVLMPE